MTEISSIDLPDDNYKEVKSKTIKGIKWNTLNTIITQGIVFIIGLVLMRLLSPKDFGLLGMVTVFSGFLNIFRDVGLGNSIIFKKHITQHDKDTVFWATVAVGFLCSALLFASSPILGWVFDEPKIIPIAQVLSLSFVIQSLSSFQGFLLKRDLDYKLQFFAATISAFLAGSISVYLAFTGFGVWALVVNQLLTTTFNALLIWIFAKYRPRFNFSKTLLREHLKFGLPILGTTGFNYVTRNADNFFIGLNLGKQALGYYSRAYSIILMPTQRISGVLSSVLFPSISKIRDDKDAVKRILMKAMRITAFITFPLLGYLILFAEYVVLIVFGKEWFPMVLPLKILCFYGILQSVFAYMGPVMYAYGKTKLNFYFSSIRGILNIIVFIIGSRYSITLVAILIILVEILMLFPILHLVGRIIGIKLLSFVSILVPHMLILLLMGVFFYIVDYYINFKGVTILFISSFLFFSTWLIFQYLFNRKVVNELLLFLKRK